MRIELQKQIVEACPNLYRGKDLPITECLMAFGIETQDGWYQLIYDLSVALEALILQLPEDEREHYYAMQIKEKYGTLCYYLSCGTDEMFALVEKAEEESGTICEECGQPGKLREQYHWLYTACDECNAKRQSPMQNGQKSLLDILLNTPDVDTQE